jgi:catechol 2,3-dioxygenase-like lactoylglutathione lyase family enzyme
MAIRWTHITIMVSDLDRSIDFYTRMCGLEVVRDRRAEGGSTVWLGPAPPEGEHPAYVLVIYRGEVTDHVEHLGFQCDTREEVDAIAREAERGGILVHPPTDSGGSVGYWTLVRDPDGHGVEFTCGQPLKGLS